jgi:hypothetical protein
MPTDLSPKPLRVKSPQEKAAWKIILLGFLIVMVAGVVHLLGPRSGNPELYRTAGNYLIVGGLAVYIVGRIQRWRARREP